MTSLLLHSPDGENVLRGYYNRAFANAIELFIVTAFLTEWDTALQLNPHCRFFRVITGRDFGITRKSACKDLLRWLPVDRKSQFLIADEISGFHPKAVFWREDRNRYFAIVGSSNLTRAAFETNYEANAYFPISRVQYNQSKAWIKRIEKMSLPVSEEWLERYNEMPLKSGNRITGSNRGERQSDSLFMFELPRPAEIDDIIGRRRLQIAAYEKKRKGLLRLFRNCALGNVTSDEFYEQLPRYWSYKLGNRLQGPGFERLGRGSDFHALSKSFIHIVDASDDDRDDIVVEEIEFLHKNGIATRAAFLSEMLCLRFPELYPVLNKPVRTYFRHNAYSAPRGASEGTRYIDLAKKLRFSLVQNADYPAKNLAELDAIIWHVHGDGIQ